MATKNKTMNISTEVSGILAKLTLKEKIALTYGANFWQTIPMEKVGIPTVMMSDGPHGLRKQNTAGEGADMLGVQPSQPATCFPTGVCIGNSWDVEVASSVGEAIAREANAQEVDVFLGPGINIKRNPLCGRNFEYYSEDPYLTGKLAAAYIAAAEAQGSGTSLKHFAANSQEHRRFVSDSVIDERALREIYLRGFEIAVKEGKPSTVMCAYNKINGTYCSDNQWLLNDVLRKEWGFEGMVVTDWGALNDRIKAYQAGCDLSMPGGGAYMATAALAAVGKGTLKESDIDACAARIIKLALKGKIRPPQAAAVDYDAQHELARTFAERCAVLLQNNDSLLPLNESTSLALIGSMATKPRYQGAGSSLINPTRLSSLSDAMPGVPACKGYHEDGSTGDDLINEAVQLAGKAEVAVICAGLPAALESEGYDRCDMKLPEGHNRLIEAVAKANPNTVVILYAGSAVETPWAEKVKAILYMGLPGQAGGKAAHNLLYGKANPSGRLAETWPLRYEDCPSAATFGQRDTLYMESIFVGYRYYTSAQVAVRWGFGHGLSYTSFKYTDLVIDGLNIDITIQNTGAVPGAEVVQLYLQAPSGKAFRPLHELKGFQKVHLQPGESRRVHFTLSAKDFAIWENGWVVMNGSYTLIVCGGLDSGNVLTTVYEMKDEQPEPQGELEGNWYYCLKGKPDQASFEHLMGKPYQASQSTKGQYSFSNSLEEMRKDSRVMAMMYNGVKQHLTKALGSDNAVQDSPAFKMILAATVESPVRNLVVSGGIDEDLIGGLIDIANRHPLQGLSKILQSKRKPNR